MGEPPAPRARRAPATPAVAQTRDTIAKALAAVDDRLATGASYELFDLIKLAQRLDPQVPGDLVRAHLERHVEAGKAARVPLGEGVVRYQRRVGRPVR